MTNSTSQGTRENCNLYSIRDLESELKDYFSFPECSISNTKSENFIENFFYKKKLKKKKGKESENRNRNKAVQNG